MEKGGRGGGREGGGRMATSLIAVATEKAGVNKIEEIGEGEKEERTWRRDHYDHYDSNGEGDVARSAVWHLWRYLGHEYSKGEALTIVVFLFTLLLLENGLVVAGQFPLSLPLPALSLSFLPFFS